MSKLDVLNNIVELTVTLCSAIDGKDIDVVEYVLSEREKQITKLEESADVDDGDQQALQFLTERYIDLHEKSLNKLKQFMSEIQQDLDSTRKEQSKLNQAQNVQEKYSASYSPQGSVLDIRK